MYEKMIYENWNSPMKIILFYNIFEIYIYTYVYIIMKIFTKIF